MNGKCVGRARVWVCVYVCDKVSGAWWGVGQGRAVALMMKAGGIWWAGHGGALGQGVVGVAVVLTHRDLTLG